MKKILIIVAVAAVVVTTLGVAGYAYAQDTLLPDPRVPFSSDMPGGRGGRGAGRRGSDMNAGGDMGLLEDYMHPAIADAFGLTVDELDSMHDEGVTLWQYAEEQGLSSEEFSALMQAASVTATNNAVADGVITQEQADFMLARTQNFGAGDFPGAGQRGPGMSSGRGGFPEAGQRSPGMNAGGNMGLLEDYMQPAIADAIGLTVDELEALHEDGFNLRQYAEDQGLSEDDLQTLMTDAFTNAVNAAIADGAITQEQADFMLGRMQNFGKGRP